jgi:hypothetical protein
MTPKEELIDFVTNLTDEEIEKLFTHLSELSSLLEEASLPCPRGQTLQNQ